VCTGLQARTRGGGCRQPPEPNVILPDGWSDRPPGRPS
jgi:hypothetical protein